MTTVPDPKARLLPRIPVETIGGLPVAALSRERTARTMIELAIAARNISAPPVVFTSANGQKVSLVAGKSGQSISDLMAGAHVISADGQPLVFASRLIGKGQIRERCASTDLFHDVARLASEERVTFYILGATADENRKAVENARRQYPKLTILGSRHGYFSGPEEEEQVVQEINRLAPDIVWVALGFPRELEFCMHWRRAMPQVGALKTCGGLLNFLSGARSRAPRWMRAAGLEWSYRVALEPRRLMVRYLITNVHAAWLLLSRTH